MNKADDENRCHTMRKDIAIIGIACRFPGATDYHQFAYNVMQGINSIQEIPLSRWDINKYYSPNFEEPNKSISKWCGLIDHIHEFDNHFFNISPREANNMDPQQRLLLEESWHCIEDSGVSLKMLQQKRTSVYVGVMSTDFHHESSAPDVIVDGYAGLGNYDCILANRLSYFYGFTGISLSINAACASSLVALHEAKRSLILRESDYCLVSGVSLNFHPLKYISFSKSRMLSPDGQCKTFDKDANGYVPGEGIGVLLLKRLQDAIADGNHIYAIIKGSAVNHGGKTLTITAPRVKAQRDVIIEAYKDADFSPETVTYVEAHGTGTSLGDPIEVEALTQAFHEYTDKTQFCKIGSVKTNIGHLEASAGIAGVIKVVLMMQHRKIPKTLNIKTLNPMIDFKRSPFLLASELSDWQGRGRGESLRAGVSSFGFGGVNCHMLLEEYTDTTMDFQNESDSDHLFILSAKSSRSLICLIEAWKSFVESTAYSEYRMSDICTTLKVGRGHFPYRWGALVHTKDELKEMLPLAAPIAPEKNKNYWCLRIGDFSFESFTPLQGYLKQFNVLIQNLEKVEKCFFDAGGSREIIKAFYSTSWPEIHQPLFSFMVVYTGTVTLMELGFSPDVITGEKSGVIVGLVLSGIMKLEDALSVLSNQKELTEITFTRPKIPYFDPHLKKTIMPFDFDEHYLHVLKDELGKDNRLLGQVLVDGILYIQENGTNLTEKQREETVLGKLLMRDGFITDEQLADALAEQHRTNEFLGSIIVRKGYCSEDDLSESLIQQDIVRSYVYDVFRHYVDKARLLNMSQATFKKYLEEWNSVLKKSGRDLLELLYDDKLLSQKKGRLRNEKLLLEVIIVSCLRKLNRKWNLTEQKLVEEKRFYELVDLVTDGFMPKEDLAEFFISDNPDYARIARTLNRRQVRLNLSGSYRYPAQPKPKIMEITDVSRWLAEPIEGKNIPLADHLAYLPLDEIAFYEIGVVSASLPVETAIHLKMTGNNIQELLTESVLKLWLHGVDIQWGKLYEEGSYKKVALPTYPFDRKSFWLPRNGRKIHSIQSSLGETTSSGQSLKLELKEISETNIISEQDDRTQDKKNNSRKQTDVNGSDGLKLSLKKKKTSPSPKEDAYKEYLKTIEQKINRQQMKGNTDSKKSYLREKIKEIVACVLYTEPSDIQENKPFIDLGIDSIVGVELIKLLNKEFNIDAKAATLYDYPTISELSDYLETTSDSDIEHQSKPLPMKKENKPKIKLTKGNLQNTNKIVCSNNAREMSVQEIAIIGISGRFSGAKNIEEFWQNLCAGKSTVIEIPKERWDVAEHYDQDPQNLSKTYCKWGGILEDIDKFDPLFFNISGKEAELTDPQQRLFLEESWKALEDAGYASELIANTKCGVFVGAWPSDYLTNIDKDGIKKEAQIFWGNDESILATRIAYFLNLKGPSIAINTACSSSLVAIHLACQSILLNEIDMALAGGVFIRTTPHFYILASNAGMLSPTGKCHTFDNSADGFVPGEGVGVIVLKPLESALDDGDYIYGIIKGSGINQDGATNGITAPNSLSQTELELSVYEKSNINPETISYIETHGTGTKLGDPIEIEALASAFRKYTAMNQYCGIGSVKTNIGHAATAAGIASLIKVLLALKHKKIPPSLNFEKANEYINFQNSPFFVNTQLKEWDTQNNGPRRAAISSFGFSGTNCHMVIEEAPKRSVTRVHYQKESDCIILLSAKNEERLKAYAKELIGFLEKVKRETIDNANSFGLSDIAYTLQIGRKPMEERLAVIASSIEEMAEKIKQYSHGKADIEKLFRGNAKVDKTKVELLIEGKEGEEFINTIITDGKLSKIAQLWVFGVEIDWRLLYPNHTPKRIPLPTYPFARERYWIQKSNNAYIVAHDRERQSVKLHPMINQNTSTLFEERFSTNLIGDEFYLENHIVGEQKILPAVAYLEIARAAGEIAGERNIRKLKNIVWTRPIILAEIPRKLHISLYPNQDVVDYEVNTNDENDQRIVHAQGKLVFDNQDGSKPKSELIDIEAIRKRCSNTKSGEECYTLFQTKGLKYGPSFQAIRELLSSGTEAISYLELPSNLKEGFKDFVLHPTLMDAAVQTVMGLMDNIEADILYLPYSLGVAELVRPIQERCYAYVVLTKNPQTYSSQIQRFTILLVDKAGQILVRMNDFSLMVFQQHLKTRDSLMKLKMPQIMYYHSVWRKAGLDPRRIFQKSSDFILLFDINEDVRNALKEKLMTKEEKIDRVILVKPGKDFINIDKHVYEINPGQKENYVQLVKAITDQNMMPRTILHLWSQEAFASSKEALYSQLERGVYSLLYLTQALMKQKPRDNIKILYIYLSIAGKSQPLYAAVNGLAKTIYKENSKFDHKIVEIRTLSMHQSAKILSQKVDILWSEMQTEKNDGVKVCYEGEQRWVKEFEEFDLEREAALNETSGWTVSLKDKGVYLLTGGAGGLGLIFAKYLATQVKVKLVLVGRSELKSEKKTKIKELKCLGAEVVYIKADISKRGDVIELIAKAKSRFNKINGIIHCAGVIHDAYIIKKTKEEMDAVLAPKVYGTVYLDEATQNEDLDFFVLFSSISAEIGNPGQSDYAYGNSFMDHFANMREAMRRKGERSGKTLSINWPLWQKGGMEVDAHTEELFAWTMGIRPLETEDGLNAFAKGLVSKKSQIIVVKGDHYKIDRLLRETKNDPNQAPADAKSEMVRPDESQLLERMQEELIICVSEILKVKKENIDLYDDMREYGFDSITFTEFANRINRKFNLQLTPPIFFEYASIGSFGQYLFHEYKGGIINYYQDSLKVNNNVIQEEHNDSGARELTFQSRFQNLQGNVFRQSENKTYDVPEPIAIIGISGVMPQSEDLETFWKNLEGGKDLITEIPKDRWDWQSYYGDPSKEANKTNVKWGGFMKEVDKFDASFFGISPREAELMDPQQRVFMETVWKTIEDAGYKPSDLSGTNTGVYVGVANTDYNELIRDREIEIEAHTSTGTAHSILANRISYLLNLHGPSEPIDTACSSSLIAIHRAVQAIRNMNCEMAIAGGVNVMLTPTLYISFSKAGMLCEDGRCKTFDKGANGYVRGEGVGAILLKPLSKAEADGDHIYAVIKGTAENHGGHANSLTAPNPNAQADLLISAYEEAQIDPGTVNYIEAHGTGTSLGDPIEVNGLKKAFEELYKRWNKTSPTEAYCGLGSVKTNIGHLETAAGIASILKVLLAMKYKKLPASINFKELNPYIQLEGSPFYIVTESKSWDCMRDNNNRAIPRRAGISSFGYGGVNAHIVIEEYATPVTESSHHGPSPQIIILSAENEERLRAYANKMKYFLNKNYIKYNHQSSILRDIAYVLQVGREAMEERLAVIVLDLKGLTEKLTHYYQGETDIENIYLGNIKSNKANTKLIIEGDEGKDFVRNLITNKKLTKLAQLWIAGVEIEWKLLYQPHLPNRISLPSYPFTRKRYWVRQKGSGNKKELLGTKKLYFLDNAYLSDNKTHIEILYDISIEKNILVRENTIFKYFIMQADSYIEMVYEIIQNYTKNKQLCIDKIFIYTPLLCIENALTQTRQYIKKVNDIIKFSIFSKIMNCEETFRKNLEGIAYVHNKPLIKNNKYKIILDNFEHRLDNEQLYLSDDPLQVGEFFRSIKEIKINGKKAVGTLYLVTTAYNGQFLLHPSIMNGVFRAVIAFAKKHTCIDNSQTFIPIYIDNITIFKELIDESYKLYVKVIKINPEFMSFNIDLIDNQDNVVLSITGLDEKKININDIMKSISYIKKDIGKLISKTNL
ncbi:MAG: SDR family NAD(P)-dependent oxidoreductase [bacterium]